MPLTAVSPDHSILAVFNKLPSSQRILIQCYDAKISLGSLKYTLSANSDDSNVRKIKFVSSHFLIAATENNAIHVFDLRRGVLSQTIKLATHFGKLCDVTAHEQGESSNASHLFALVFKDGKTIVVVYDLSNSGKMVKKVKTGSCANDECMALSAVSGSISVRLGKKVKILDASTGKILGKIKTKGGDADSNNKLSPFLCSSSDGKCFALNSSQELHFFLFDGESVCRSLGTTLLENVTNVSIMKDESTSRYIISATDTITCSILEIKTSQSKKTRVKPFAYMRRENSKLSSSGTNLDCFFSSGEDLVMVELVSKGIQSFGVNLVRVEWKKNGNGNLYPKDEDDGKEKGLSSLKKRKLNEESSKNNVNVVLGPGESGGEVLHVSDFSAKRVKHEDDSENDFVLEDDDDSDDSTTIAQRLALLSSHLDQDDDERDLLIRNTRGQNFAVKNATSDSLVVLLKQALEANDDSQLEIALQVSDEKIIENSIMALSAETLKSGEEEEEKVDAREVIIMLLTKLVTRLSRKPSRAQQLSYWIRTVLVVLISSSRDGSMKMGKAEKDIASRLAPLRSMLSERVESLPALLRLEGRLGLIGKQI